MAIAGTVRSRAIPPFAGQCAQPARDRGTAARLFGHLWLGGINPTIRRSAMTDDQLDRG